MVLKLPKIILLSVLMVCFSLTSCEDLYIVNCDECEETEPLSCILKVELDQIPGSGNYYNVTIYRGKIDDGIVLYNTNTITSVYYQVSLNSDYSATASIIIDGREYTAVGATRPEIDVITDVCEETCYYVVNNSINLSLKYY